MRVLLIFLLFDCLLAIVQYRHIKGDYDEMIYRDAIKNYCSFYDYDFSKLELYIDWRKQFFFGHTKKSEPFADSIHVLVSSEINRTVAEFCLQPNKLVTPRDDELDNAFNKLIPYLNVTAKRITQILKVPYQMAVYYLQNFLIGDVIAGFAEQAFKEIHIHERIINYTYSNIECLEPLQIRANVCISTIYNAPPMLVYRKQTNDETKLPLFGVAAAYKWAFLNETTCEKRNIIDGKAILLCDYEPFNFASELKLGRDCFVNNFDYVAKTLEMNCEWNVSNETIQLVRSVNLGDYEDPSNTLMFDDMVYWNPTSDIRNETMVKSQVEKWNKEIAQLRAAQYNYPSTVVTLTSTSSRPSSPSNSVFIFVVVFLLLLSLLLNLFFIVKFFKFTERFRIQYFRDTVNFIRFD